MKKYILSLVFMVAFALGVNAQSSACIYTTCVPQIPITNTGDLQIYGAILGTSRNTSVTVLGGTVAISGTVPVTGTVTANVSGTVSASISNTVTVTGNVGGYTAKPQSTLSADGLYAAGDNVGGLKSFTAFRTGQNSGVLLDVTVWDTQTQNANLTIDFYLASPSGTFTNNAPQVMSDPVKYLGSVNITSSDYITTGSISRASVTGVNLPIVTAAGVTTVYYTVVTSSTPTYGSNQTVYFSFGILQD